MNEFDIWFGTEASYYELQRLLSIEPQLGWFDSEPDNPIKYEVVEGIAVANISGPLISKPTFFSRYVGITSYEDVKEFLSDMAGDRNVNAVLFNYDTPGGAAKGCRACASFVREYAESLKPVYSITEEVAASAGLWLYSSGLVHFVSEDGRLGSVGAIAMHSEVTEMRKKAGITDTIFRTAKFKALGGPFEKLSDDAKAEIEEGLQILHDQFVDGISELSGINREKVDKSIATGKVFRADRSMELGLADELLPLGEVIGKLAAKHKKPSKPKS